jgi:hypothetical protein
MFTHLTPPIPRRPLLRALWSGVILSTLLASAHAQTRWVFVNGQRLSDAQVQQLGRANCSAVADGSYWLNPQNGAWGYAGNPVVQGVVGDGCRAGGPGGGVNQDGTRGPFATMRRAEEVANQYRSQGLRAVAFHNGDGYYVRVSR